MCKKCYFIVFFIFSALLPLTALTVSPIYPANSSDITFDSYPVEEALWIGPGWYYGIWFGDEVEYKNFCRSHEKRMTSSFAETGTKQKKQP